MFYRRKRRPTRRPRKTTRRRYIRKKPLARRTTTTRLTRQPVSDRLFTRLHYVQNLNGPSMAAGVLNTVATYQTSLFDPDVSVGGHQPLWFDQYCPSMYTNYRVFAIKWSIIAVNRGINETWYLSARNQNSSTPEASLQTLMERRDSRTRMASSVNGSNGTVRLSGYLSLAKVRGISPKDVSTDNIYEAAYNANPAAMGYVLFYLQHLSSTPQTVFDFTIRLTYYCELSGRVSPFGS